MLTLFLDWRVLRPHRRGPVTAVCALALIVGLALAGCATKPEATPTTTSGVEVTTPAPKPTESVEPAETPSPEPSEPEPSPAPTPPDPAQLINENTEEGAKSAVQYFWDLQTFAMTSQSLELWDRSTSKECEFCKATSAKVHELKEASLFVEGGEVSAGEVTFIEEKWSRIWLIEHQITESAVTVKTDSGESASVTENSEGTVQMYLKFIDNAWLLEEVSS